MTPLRFAPRRDRVERGGAWGRADVPLLPDFDFYSELQRHAHRNQPAQALCRDRHAARRRRRRASRASSRWIGDIGRASRSPRCASASATKCAITRRAAWTSGRRAGKPSPRAGETEATAKGFAQAGQPTLAVTHRGVIRALFAEATGWDMRGKPPARLDWSAVHVFSLDDEGAPRVERLNVK